ncbi:hypothetical protein [Cryptosporangium sp. NPDC051539]|uniref:hypothetical protein n=1 Tax=Cryptosporangium sp. NPDC051539 TaxID=3363962 RepID=UPI00378F62FC
MKADHIQPEDELFVNLDRPGAPRWAWDRPHVIVLAKHADGYLEVFDDEGEVHRVHPAQCRRTEPETRTGVDAGGAPAATGTDPTWSRSTAVSRRATANSSTCSPRQIQLPAQLMPTAGSALSTSPKGTPP